MTHILSFLGHDGIRLLIFLFVIVGNIVKSQAKAAKNRDAQLRGGTAIRDFSEPETPVAANSLEPNPGNSSASGAASAPRASASTASAPRASAPRASAPRASASSAGSAPLNSPLNSPRPSASASKPPASSQGSPWSSNQNPFG